MTNQELIANLDIDQKTGKISFEQWWAMKSGVEKLVMGSVEIDAEEMEAGYTEAEENCKGCMGPCGMCEFIETARQGQMEQIVRELEEIVKLGAKMRTAQKAYFRTRTSDNLEKSKILEREFDVRATKKLDEEPKKPTLFG